jgi:dienelactone hydrolase
VAPAGPPREKTSEDAAMKWLLAIILVLGVTGEVQAKVVTKTVEYRLDGTVLKGYLAYDDLSRARRPGVLVVHEWWGLNDYAKKRAEQLAGLDREEAARWAGALMGTPQLRARAQAALQALAANPLVSPGKLAAIGFCFGGTTVLELAYSGADLAGVVSFHGGLPLPQAADLKRIKASILVLHGADDPHTPPAKVAAWEDAMRAAGPDWQLVLFGGAVHTFTNPAAGADKSTGSAYDARAERRSWRYMRDFFQEIFGVKGRD